MRKNKLFLVILLLSLTHCAANAQWVLTNCPQGPECLTANEQYIFSGGEGGAFRSSDNGNTWGAINKGFKSDLDPSEVVNLYTIGKYVIATLNYSRGIFISSDNGAHWVQNTYPQLAFGFFCQHNKYLFSSPTNNWGVYRSLDSGNVWALDTNGIFPFYRFNNKGIFVPPITVGNMIVTANYDGQVFRSENDGDTWNLIYDHLDAKFLRLYSINDTTIFAYAADSILRSTNLGISWKTIKQGFGGGKIITVNEKIFAVQGYNIFISTNNGDSWKSVFDNLPDSTVIDALTIKDNYIFAGEYNQGLWRRPLSDFASVAVQPKESTITPINVKVIDDRITVEYFSEVEFNHPKFEVYDILGRLILKVVENRTNKGWNKISCSLPQLTSGTYICTVSVSGISHSQRIQIIR